MARIAAVIGVEKYRSTGIPRVAHARADANAIAEALAAVGFDIQLLLLDEQATKTTVEATLEDVILGLRREDTFLLFFAGHGLSVGKFNYLLCHDTDNHEVARTGVALQRVFDLLKASICEKVIIFLDACQSGLLIDESMRSVLSTMNPKEARQFLEKSEHCVCFSSSNSFQTSWGSRKLGHGIWTYHLLKALRGEEPTAIERDGLVTSTSLQSYLSIAVPATVRETYTGKSQTPYLFGTQSKEFVIADVGPLIAARKVNVGLEGPVLKRIQISAEAIEGVKRLSGFDKKKGHFVPTSTSGAAENFIDTLTSAEIKSEINTIAKSSRATFDYVRGEVDVGFRSGGGTLITPGFEYSVSVALDPDDFSQVIWRRTLRNIRPDVWGSEELDGLFAGTFDTLELDFSDDVNIEELIDRIEAMRNPAFGVDYEDSDLSRCEVLIEGFDGKFDVTESGVRIQSRGKSSPSELIDLLKSAQQLYIEGSGHGLPLGLPEPKKT